MRRILIPLLITVAVVGIAGGLALWIHNQMFYYRTDAAVVESKLVSIDAPQAGTLTDISVKKGDTVQMDDKIGTEKIYGPNGEKDIDLKSPVSGTVVLTTTKGSLLTQGYPVAGINNESVGSIGEATVIAFVDESVLERVRIGQQADVTVDAYGHTIYTGRVEQIVREAANQFTDTQSQDFASGNFTKVSQRVPVLIGLDAGTQNSEMLPGTSAEVIIHLL